MIHVDQIVELYHQRETGMGREFARMRRVLDTYNGDLALPLPELGAEIGRHDQAGVANFLAVGLDQTSMRVADPTPNVSIPALKQMKKWQDKARDQRRALLGHFEQNSIKRKMRRRARHLLGYGTGSLIPILVIGFVRRVDLDRRQSPFYEANRLMGPAIAVLAVVALVAAGLHVWPIATELAS